MSSLSYPERVVITLAAAVVIAAGMKAASVILVPGLLALFVAIICLEPMRWMIGLGVPRSLAIVLVLIALLLFTGVIGLIISGSLVNFTERLPEYQRESNLLLKQVNALLLEYDVGDVDIREFVNPTAALGWVQALFNALTGILSRYFLILIFIVFILVDTPVNGQFTGNAAVQIMQTVQHYFAIKTFTSFLTGGLIALFVYILDIDYPLLWGFLGFLLNFIPNIGSFLAAIPPVLLALLFQGWIIAVVAAAGYLVINVFVSNFVEPRIMGQQLGLRFVVIFTSLIVWGYVLGPVGMLLAVPLTITLRIIFDNHPDTQWLANLLKRR